MKEELVLQQEKKEIKKENNWQMPEGLRALQEKLQSDGGMPSLPYNNYLSFAPLINDMRKGINENGFSQSPIKIALESMLESAPELTGPIKDLSLLEKHRPLVELFISSVISPMAQQTQLAKLSLPFDMNSFFHTEAVTKMNETHTVSYEISQSQEVLSCMTTISSGSLILNRFYGQNLKIVPPVLISAQEDGKQTKRFFKLNMDTSFVDILPLKPLKPLSKNQINKLLNNIYDKKIWLEAMPADAFEFRGFMKTTLVEITEEESMSRLKQSLLQPDAIFEKENIKPLGALVRNYVGVEGLELGITALDYPLEESINHKYKIRYNILADEFENLLDPQYANSIYEKACKYREVLLVEDLKKIKKKTDIELALLARGFRSIIIAPLLNKKKEIIGLMEVLAPEPYALNSFIEIKFKEIINLFSIAIERSRRERDNQVEAIIREQFTDIHPSLEWRFVKAAHNLLENREEGNKYAVVEPIIFHDVYPLYGQADIVGSSRKRNSSIRADLLDNLSRVKKVLELVAATTVFPLINKFMMDVDLAIADLDEEFNSNDESRIVDLLHQFIHPALRLLQRKHQSLSIPVENYFNGLDDHYGIVYKKRKAYEDTVTMINNAIGDYLDEQDKIAQLALPHYYTKYKTDGVEYNLYFGKSLLLKDEYCTMHLHNFRLQQLIDMCNITKLVHDMQDTLPEKLDTAQLVFAYTNTLSIRFRMDEKQFDVDGAYNVRYEILKKRIDKAVIEGTDERLTQAGKVAVVYLQDKDRQEYLDYFKYLHHQGLITDNIEELTLGKLQGAQGLKALRVTVVRDSS